MIRYGDFSTAKLAEDRVMGFVKQWNDVEAHPFRWTWRSDASQNARGAGPWWRQRGRWGRTGLRATRDALVDSLVGEFGWVLTDIAGENLGTE